MNAQKLLSRFEDKRHIGFFCSKCGQDYYIGSGGPGLMAKAKRSANECCVGDYCGRCDKKLKGFDLAHTYCDQCTEFNTVKKAKHIAWDDYEGRAVFTENAPGGREGYYFDDDLTERCDDEGVEPPCYVYACTPVIFELDLYEYVSSKFYDHVGEDGMDDFTDDEQLDSLHKSLNEWATKQTVMYEVDTGLVVVLDDKRFQEYLQKDDKKA